MADVVRIVVAQATENLTENVVNGTAKAKSTPEGMAMAYGSLTIMALLPIVFGSYRSVNYHKENVCMQSASTNRVVCVNNVKSTRQKCSLRVIFFLESRENDFKRCCDFSNNGIVCIVCIVYSI